MGEYTLRVGERTGVARVQAKCSHFEQAAKPLGLALLIIVLGACGDGEKPSFPINAKAAGPLVSVDKGDTVVGFYGGTIKATHKVERFKISKHPINNDQYKKCLAAGVCKLPKLSECSDQELAKAAFDSTGETASICVGYENAKAFCQWVGGRLPTLPEWLRAARGAEIQRYPWGRIQGSCKQHPRIDYEQLRYSDSKNREGCFASTVEALVVRRHAEGVSRSGMEDMLIAPAELVVGESNNTFGACGEGRPCTVYGEKPGSIDSVASYNVTQAGIQTGDETQEPELTPKAYAFRCVVEK